ncbi:FtsX-like permease family protein [Puniceibacterium sp. IMCC21224]|uniref:FtsX-like permease family protein n=1 Tax=Puniceibacterium sp. IMCC21224 TaxID=1618204 RepID=UPI00065CF2AB|nr:FtsX-like permease family protein [Puniceibacterium sp. IMCC21224]KMK66726.1 MacB-like periplasmic core domain/FtsX-like permease family [Puniceibacterium sp. IMCC21224]
MLPDILTNLWVALPNTLQDTAILVALLLPTVVIALWVSRGLAPGALTTSMLRRFAPVNLVFIGLVALSVALGVGLTAQERALRQGSARAADKFDLIVTAPGSEITSLLTAVYLQPNDLPLLSGAQYAEIEQADGVSFAAPLAFGDNWQGHPVVGTTADFVTHLSDDRIAGRMFSAHEEAVAGAFAPVEIGDEVVPSHGAVEIEAEVHDDEDGHDDHEHHDIHYKVVGKLPPTGSPWDRAILVPVEIVWELHGLANGHNAATAEQIGPPFTPDLFPGTPAVLIKPEQIYQSYALRTQFSRADMMAFFPGAVLSQLHGLAADVRAAMSLLTIVSQILVAVAILAGLMMIARLFARNLAVLRALGAAPRFLLAVVWSYAATLLTIGTVLGLGLGIGAAAMLSRILTARTSIQISAAPGWTELHLAAGFLTLALLCALLPALLAMRRSPLRDLRS